MFCILVCVVFYHGEECKIWNDFSIGCHFSPPTAAKLSIHYGPMIAVTLLMIVGGIGLSQAVSDPHQVTLRWLRLGGIIALSLLGVTSPW